MTRKSSRRDFLRGRSAAEALADTLPAAVPEEHRAGQPCGAPGAGYLLRVGRRAMACEFEVCLNAGQYENGAQAALEVLDLVETLEEQLSYFRATSEISRINRLAAQARVEVEPRLFDLLRRAIQVCSETGGAFDLASAPLWEAWGFSRRAGSIPSPDTLAEALARVGSRLVELDPQRRTVRFRREGVRLNLGSVGKGYALDRCAEKLLQAGAGDFLLHGGYSSVLGHGSEVAADRTRREDAPAGWTVGIRHPLNPEREVAEVHLHDRALSTSGSWAQSFRHQGRRYGHILDPRTGQPADGAVSATVLAPDATLAEMLSTAFYVMGPQRAAEYCQSRPQIAALLICPGPHGDGNEVHCIGLSDKDLTIL